ncbi:DUF1289 domain-containing protein [Natronospirillum operosum]|uniref:DUF1289 domain-containing protein n=1 Tax=Natronospirillum operosum TaxID=2759953 RepID=A0A4Z0WBI0_9GAMM|nr:DUF1289 domain-containing protein [Natronospirillum operosum]TGG92032.1 DUF1289 domain-containing protein [Natronospirillum operosum]
MGLSVAGTAAQVSPCIGICSVTVGDTVCRGCFRTLDDIACWGQLDDTKRQRRLLQRQQMIEQTFHEHFQLLDAQRLFSQWARYIRTPPEPAFAAEAWLHLLQKGAHKIQDPQAYGVRVLPLAQNQSLRQIWRTWRQQLMEELG